MTTCKECADRCGFGPCRSCRERGEARERRTAARAADTAQRYRAAEDRVLAGAARLDPADGSVAARQVREETADSIRDHRAAEARTGGSL